MRAILSVWDKSGLAELGKALAELGVELYSTGGTYKHLTNAGLAAKSVEDLTGFPEILGGRVKTLHPAVHGGLLARRDVPEQMAELAAHGLEPIDVVVCNLYPFRETVAKPNVTLEDAIENIDIGGVTLLRAAAKNYAAVIILSDPADYGPVIEEWQRDGQVSDATRKRLAAKAFAHTASYDAAIAAYLLPTADGLSDTYDLHLEKAQELRYGENPHQQAALYHDNLHAAGSTLVGSLQQLHGKELSYNNLLDADSALAVVRDFSSPTVAIIKHNNPCGVASRDNLVEAFDLALAGDPVSAFGGIVSVNRRVERPLAEAIAKIFFEVVVAPGFDDDAVEILAGRRNLRLLAVADSDVERRDDDFAASLQFVQISGGFLVQTRDAVAADQVQFRPVTSLHPNLEQIGDLMFAWRVVKHVKSNAIVLVKDMAVVGIGAGQPSRVDSAKIAVSKAGWRAEGSVMASDAFMPFPDSLEEGAKAGVVACVQPGGSNNDPEVIAAAEKANMAMVFAGRRHFRH